MDEPRIGKIVKITELNKGDIVQYGSMEFYQDRANEKGTVTMQKYVHEILEITLLERGKLCSSFSFDYYEIKSKILGERPAYLPDNGFYYYRCSDSPSAVFKKLI